MDNRKVGMGYQITPKLAPNFSSWVKNIK